jgi:hypothetical protein
MTKDEMKKIMAEEFMQDKDELDKMNYDELNKLFEELEEEFNDDSVIYPNGRDDD